MQFSHLRGRGGNVSAMLPSASSPQPRQPRPRGSAAEMVVVVGGGLPRWEPVCLGLFESCWVPPDRSRCGRCLQGDGRVARDGDRDQRDSLEVAVWLVVHLHVGHKVLHAGEGLCAAQRGTVEGFA